MAGAEPPARSWDATSYHAISGPMVEMAERVLARLELTGDETVLDAGCGTGRVTALLLDRLPRGRVLAVDADADMVRVAAVTLAAHAERVRVEQLDLLDLTLDREVDAILSTATFHWVLDHDRLFAALHAALRPGGRLVAQCGGAGNVANVLDAASAVGSRPAWKASFEGWERPMRYETAEATAERLRASGFTAVECWLEPNPVVPDDPHVYLETIVLGAHVERLPTGRRDEFVTEVVDLLGTPVTIEYVRLNIDARRPEAGGRR
ncbi:MAG TPA: class I SAM-dependent methyltransferase [Acidimicrobiales bacterium]|nr:class I SAM-dependent methyltransferase [Acidimicrobiales bacterium]